MITLEHEEAQEILEILKNEIARRACEDDDTGDIANLIYELHTAIERDKWEG